MKTGSKTPNPKANSTSDSDELVTLKIQFRQLQNEYELTRDEYEIAARNYLDTLADLESQKSELEKLNAHLEDRVQKRTQMLEKSSEILRQRGKRAVAQRAAIAQIALDKPIVDGDGHCALHRIASLSAATMDVARVGIWKLTDDDSKLRCLLIYDSVRKTGEEGDILSPRDFPRFLQALMEEGHVHARDAMTDPRTSEWATVHLVPRGARSMLAAGILGGGKLSGFICFEHLGPRRTWQPDEASFAGTMAAFVAQIFATDLRNRAEEEKDRLGEQLIQAQKMDAVGRLAGGVAHDFNNMLAVIMGNTELALRSTLRGEPAQNELKEILLAAKRSANLTHQLLAFARKQTANPQVIDLNEILSGMCKMLRRLIGEHIALRWIPGENVGTVKMDPSQIDQILVNLCVNARDAIHKNGKISIATHPAIVGENDGSRHAGALPGSFAKITVTDDGAGMSPQTIARLFEPFFTTKEVGKGTGLGLATVYGIVKQNGGFIEVDSAPGRGTAMSIYLPLHTDQTESTNKDDFEATDMTGHETLLLVEDELAILNITRQLLEHLGYVVLTASRPNAAIRIAQNHSGTIHLLLTDLVMPEMNGYELAERIHIIRPGIRRLFMSGHTTEALSHQGILNEGIRFIHKPFSVKGLASRVRECLAGN